MSTENPSLPPHEVRKTERGFALDIGYLQREQKRFMALTMLAVRDGSLQEINSGSIQGPKVLSLINRIRTAAVTGKHDLRVTGQLLPYSLSEEVKRQVNAPSEMIAAERWTQEELIDYRTALKDLKLTVLFNDPRKSMKPYDLEVTVTAGKSSVLAVPSR